MIYYADCKGVSVIGKIYPPYISKTNKETSIKKHRGLKLVHMKTKIKQKLKPGYLYFETGSNLAVDVSQLFTCTLYYSKISLSNSQLRGRFNSILVQWKWDNKVCGRVDIMFACRPSQQKYSRINEFKVSYVSMCFKISKPSKHVSATYKINNLWP